MSVREGKRRMRAREERRKTNPGIVCAEMTDDVVKDIIKGRTGEQERIQQKVFAKWINSRFAKAGSTRRIEDLFQDLRTGVTLAALVELITAVKVPVEKGKSRLHYVCNITKSLELLEQNEIKLVNVSADDIEDGNTKLTLSLTWAIIQQFYVKRLGGAVTDLRINNLEKTLLCWCQLATKGYPHVDVRNLSTSWSDGLAFNALISKYREDLFDYSALLSNTAEVNLTHAFRIAEEHLGVQPLLEPEDIVQGTPDQKSIATYLLCLLEALPHETMEVKVVAAISELDSSISSGDDTSASTSMSAYQVSVENMLAWMLSVEEELDRCDISDDLTQSKTLWYDHESLLSQMVVQQHSLQLVLEHAARLLQGQKLPSQSTAEVESHITVLTEKWENLQIKSTERSKLLGKIIRILQGEKLKSVDSWLSETEARVTSLKSNANSIESMDAQLRELSKLQDDLEKQLSVMNDLLTVMIVGDDVGQHETESHLGVFRQRWEDICRWTESQWTLVRRIRTCYDDFFKLCTECGEWIASRIELLQSLPKVADDRLDWVQRNLDLLHEMHDQMLDYQEHVQILQEKSDELVAYFTPQSSIGMQVRRRDEKVCGEWNQLVDLLEFWTSDKNMHFEKSDILRTSKVRNSKRFSETVDSGVVTEPAEENEPKTKKAKQEEMDEGLLENCDALMEWLLVKERQLTVNNETKMNGTSASESSFVSSLKEEFDGKESEYKSLRMLAEDIIAEKRGAGASSETIELKLNQLAALWNNLAWMIEGKTSPLTTDRERELFNQNLEVLEDVLISCQKTVERFKGEKQQPSRDIDRDLHDCSERIHLMDVNESRMRDTSALARKISSESVAIDDQPTSPWEEFRLKWHSAREQLKSLEADLSNAKESQPIMNFMNDLHELQEWTNRVHQLLMEEPPVRVSYLDKMETSLRHYDDVQQSISERQEAVERMNSPPKQLMVKLAETNFQMELIDLNTKWKDIRQYLQHNIDELSKWAEELRAFQIDVEGLKQWMVDVDSFLNIDIESVHDNTIFATVQEQFHGLEEDIKVLAPTVDKLLDAGRVFLKTDQKDFAQCIQECIKDLEKQWMSICSRAAKQLQVISSSSVARKRQMSVFERETQAVEELKQRLPNAANIASLDDLRAASNLIQEVKRSLAAKQESVQRLIDETKDISKKSVSGGYGQSEDLLHQLDMQLHDCNASVEERERLLMQISDKWALFTELLAEHHTWMDKLEGLINGLETVESPEDCRPQLIELNEFMNTQNSDNYATVADLAEEFHNQKVLDPLVKGDLEKLRQRLSKLFKRAQELQSMPIESDSRYSLFSESGSEGPVQSPFSNNLERVTQLLNDLRMKLPATELKEFDSTVIKGQLDECVQLYKTLSEIKGEVESLIKQGREIVEADPASVENDGLSHRLDSMKTQYNQLGAQVTATKAELDNALKLVKKAEKELEVLRIAMDEIDCALAELDKLANNDDYNDSLVNIKESIQQREETVVAIRNMRQQLREIAMKPTIPGFDPKYTQQSQRWTHLQNHMKSRQVPQVTLQKNSAHFPDPASHDGRRERFIVKEELSRGVQVVEKSVVSRQSSSHKSSPPPLNLELTHLKEYQRSLRQQIDVVHERMVLSNVTGKKHAGREVKEVQTEGDSLQKRLEDSRDVENVLHKFDVFCTQIEEKLGNFLRAPPAPTEVRGKFADLEALKHETAVNEFVHKDVVLSVDTAVTSAASVDTNQLELVKCSINNRWTSIHQNLHLAEQSLSSAQSFYRLLEELVSWLDKAEEFVDSHSAGSPISSNDLTMLIEERESKFPAYNLIIESGNSVLDNVYKSSNGEPLRSALDDVSRRWLRLDGKIQDDCVHAGEDTADMEKYLANLGDHTNWVVKKKEELSTMQPSGDRVVLQKLHDYHQLFRAQLEAKRGEIESILNKGRGLEERLQSPNLKSAPTQSHGMEDLSRSLKLLSDSWQSLFRESDSLQLETESLTNELDGLLKLCDSMRSKMTDMEREITKWEATDEVNVEDLSKKIEDTKKFKTRLDAQNSKLEEINTVAARIQRTPGGLSEEVVRSVAHLNKQKQSYSNQADERLAQLEVALEDVGSSNNQHFLATSVDEPWERRVSTNKVPYYINHADQTTQWDHPVMTDMMGNLLDANKIRFSAYRTAAKLRLVQKRLYLDLLPVAHAIEIFDKCGLRAKNDNTMDCAEAVACLMTIYERLNEQHPNRINFALGIDVCLNWLLNCHDPERTGQLRVLAFKLSIVVLSRGELSNKYKYLFRLIADADQHATQQHIAQLLHHCLQIPRCLGEVAAFGGSNVDPSVKSCFEFSTNGIDIQAKQFLAWLAREPQAMVWLSVLHRLIAAEAARHPAKCNICRQFPIVGLRYRCLKCFNFDLCQSCFFSGQRSKHHKISHPMQEYCFPASNSEDMRDFKRVLKNKLRPKDSAASTAAKLAYLPVQQSPGGSKPEHTESSTLNSLNTKGSVSSSDAADFTQSRVIEFEGSRDVSTPEVDDEHNLIARYSSLLNGTPDSAQTTVQVLQTVDREEKQEMEEYLRQLQRDHDRLISELEDVRQLHDDLPNDDLAAEASMLREDKGRLEARMKILEDHNRQLDAQLQRIKNLLEETNERNAAASPVPTNGSAGSSSRHYDNSLDDMVVPRKLHSRSPSSMNSSPALSKTSVRQDKYSVGQLFHAAGSLNVAVGTLVTVMTEEERRLEQKNNLNGGYSNNNDQ